MTLTIPQRIDALARDVRAFHQRLDRVAADAPQRAHVVPLYATAEKLQARAESLAAALERQGAGGAGDGAGGSAGQARTGVAALLNQARFAPRSVAQQTRIGASAYSSSSASGVPGSGESELRWRRAADGQDLPNVRLHGSVPQPAANLVADRLENVPTQTTTLTDALGTRGVLFSGRLTDVQGYKGLRGKQPRGWSPGKTWDIVPGAGSATGFAANASRDDRGKGHGSTSLVLHEYGHVVDPAVARPRWTRASESAEWRRGPWREARRREVTAEYYRANPEEWFAESFARFTKSAPSHAALARWYPQTYGFLLEHVGRPQFS